MTGVDTTIATAVAPRGLPSSFSSLSRVSPAIDWTAHPSGSPRMPRPIRNLIDHPLPWLPLFHSAFGFVVGSSARLRRVYLRM